MRHGEVVLVAAACAGLLAGCTAPVAIQRVTVSADQMRLEVIVNTCNADVQPMVEETGDAVSITIIDNRPRFETGHDDCQDSFIVPLDEPLGGRAIVGNSAGDEIEVQLEPVNELSWPYDRSRFTEAQYNAALDAMVKCLMTEDPEVTAWVEQGLDWKVWGFSKPVDENGTMTMFATQGCQAKHLDPLG